MTSKLIVALDFNSKKSTLDLVDQLDPSLCSLKIGSQLFTQCGPALVTLLIKKGFNVFLDLKFHDIPNTVARACKAAADLGVWMLNIHASGGLKMMTAALNALEPYGKDKPILIGVTVLTSFNEDELIRVGVEKPVVQQACNLASLTKQAELNGVVCSAYEVKIIKELCGSNFLTITPGIRPPNSQADDQSRIMTPRQAMEEGSDYVVVGRPITRSLNPVEVVHAIINNLN
jgi:orotidine-5'-phosphate decarboxylase